MQLLTLLGTRNIAIGIMFIAVGIVSLCATEFDFDYDGAGNRIKRLIVPSKQSYPSTDQIANSKIIVYPNPTFGSLKIDITNLSEDKPAFIKIMELTGRMIWEKSVTSVTIR